MQGVQVPSLVRHLRSHMPHSQKTKTQNRSNIVTNSIKTLKMVHIKKILKKKRITSPLPPQQPCRQITWKRQHLKSQPVRTQCRMMQNPTSCLNDALRFFPPFFPLKIVLAEQNLRSWSLDMSPPSPQIAPFLSTDTCLSNDWLLSGKQRNLSLVTP